MEALPDYDYTRKTYTMTYNPVEFLYDAFDVREQNFDGIDLGMTEEQSLKKTDTHSYLAVHSPCRSDALS